VLFAGLARIQRDQAAKTALVTDVLVPDGASSCSLCSQASQRRWLAGSIVEEGRPSRTRCGTPLRSVSSLALRPVLDRRASAPSVTSLKDPPAAGVKMLQRTANAGVGARHRHSVHVGGRESARAAEARITTLAVHQTAPPRRPGRDVTAPAYSRRSKRRERGERSHAGEDRPASVAESAR
jgi:hypothetical protein